MIQSSKPPKKLALQMDPIESLNHGWDSSLLLAYEASQRGYQLFHYLPSSLSLTPRGLIAHGVSFTVSADGLTLTQSEKQTLQLEEMDVLMIRQDPPFDMSYITATYLLEHLKGKVCLINNPTAIRDHPEKILMTHFKDLIPPTLISSTQSDIESFRKDYGDIVIKPLYDGGGFGVIQLKKDDGNLSALLDLHARLSNVPLIVQKYLPEVMKGDKRIILFNGQFVGGLNRIPAQGEFRSNIRAGGIGQKLEMTKRDHEICEAIGPTLKEQGLFFAGIDVIGPYLTEINVTSPTGLRGVNQFDQTRIEKQFWDGVEKHLLPNTRSH